MARNKYPEETVKKILDTAIRLFMERGYDNTSMQDIVKDLGMSKGAIYHHFKSKEELFEHAVTEYYSREDWFNNIVKDSALSGLEKLRALFRHEVSDKEKLAIDRAYFSQSQDPRMFMENLRMNLTGSAAEVAKVIEMGNQDGSLCVKYPREAAELVLMIANVWIALFADSKEKFLRQIDTAKRVMEGLGAPIFDEELIGLTCHYFETAIQWDSGGINLVPCGNRPVDSE